ncbi:MAG: hypothetical protein Q8P50_18505, partial [Bacillota bacterium]|nr:hypothetical protein [Bacillota bacterium]
MNDTGTEQASGHFVPRLVVFEQEALAFPLGKKLRQTFTEMAIPQVVLAACERMPVEKGLTEPEKY